MARVLYFFGSKHCRLPEPGIDPQPSSSDAGGVIAVVYLGINPFSDAVGDGNRLIEDVFGVALLGERIGPGEILVLVQPRANSAGLLGYHSSLQISRIVSPSDIRRQIFCAIF
jgi:hypothetical protein